MGRTMFSSERGSPRRRSVDSVARVARPKMAYLKKPSSDRSTVIGTTRQSSGAADPSSARSQGPPNS